MHTSSTDGHRNRLFTPPFVIAVVLLGLAAVLAGPVSWMLDFRQVKAALPLKAAFGMLPTETLRPYEVVQREVIPPTVVEALGTSQYLSWVLKDTSLPPNDPLHAARLLVTYYSGGNALVPHTPDVCYLGAGYEPAQPHENMEIALPVVGTIPIRVCSFRRTTVFDRKVASVVYTFYCNGQFTATRSGVRLLTHDPRDTYAFFSKVEATFPAATRERSIEGAKKLFDRVLPALVADHWPDFEAAERAAGGIDAATE